MQKQNRPKKIALNTALFLSTALASQAYAACYIDGNVAMMRSSMSPSFKVADQTIISTLQQMDVSLSKAIGQQTDIITGALKTLSSQKALAAQQVSDAIVKHTEIEMAAEDAKERSEQIQKVADEHGPRGSGYNVCGVQKEREITVKQESKVQEAIPQMVRSEITARPGKYADQRKQMADRLALHNRLYCTAEQAAHNLCEKEGPRAGKSLTAATLFEPADFGSHEYNDKSALINNMIGFADNPISKTQSSTTSGQAYADGKRRKDAIVSTAANYLKSVQAYWSGVGAEANHVSSNQSANASEERQRQAVDKNKSASGSGVSGTTVKQSASTTSAKADDTNANKSLATQIKKDVDRYFGNGDEYKKWSQSLVGLNERGVMSEILQVKALQLKIEADDYFELMQHESMLAAYVSAVLANSSLEQGIAKKHATLMKTAAAGYGGQ